MPDQIDKPSPLSLNRLGQPLGTSSANAVTPEQQLRPLSRHASLQIVVVDEWPFRRSPVLFLALPERQVWAEMTTISILGRSSCDAIAESAKGSMQTLVQVCD
jgi:hypothetical protein